MFAKWLTGSVSGERWAVVGIVLADGKRSINVKRRDAHFNWEAEPEIFVHVVVENSTLEGSKPAFDWPLPLPN